MSSPTMYADLESPPGSAQDEQRALQIALELSNLGLLGTGDDDSSTSSYDEITKSKKSQNMTECVPVPSSEHVAEIVGRQGCKIKALRAKTSTYIKTPVRGEEPVFVVTGRKEDVAMARREIQSAAEHFTQIRATRNKAGMQSSSSIAPLSGLAYPMQISPGNTSPADLASSSTITLQVRVPYRVVGLVVGPKGATIKRIQQQTHTYIVTPSRDKEPVFEVTGLPENVEKAREEIEAHIAARTGNQSRDIDDDFASNGTIVGSPASFNRSQSAFTPYRANGMVTQTTRPDAYNLPQIDNAFFNQIPGYSKFQQTSNQQSTLLDLASNGALNMYAQPGRNGLDQYDPRTDTITSASMSFDASAPPTTSWALGDLSEIASYPLFSAACDTATTNVSSSLNQQVSLSGPVLPARLSPTFSDSDFPLGPLQPASSMQSPLSNMTRPLVRRVGSDSVDSTGSSSHSLDFGSGIPKTMSSGISIESGYSSGGTTDSQTSGSPVENICGLANTRTASPPRVCVICFESLVVAALVPCGHNHFCFECANKAAKSASPCPCCNQTATMALRIKSELAA